MSDLPSATDAELQRRLDAAMGRTATQAARAAPSSSGTADVGGQVWRRTGTVDTVNATTLDVNVGGIVIPAVPVLGGVTSEQAGDDVLVDFVNKAPLVIGRAGSTILAARVTHSASQSCNSGTPTVLTFDTEHRDDGGLHDGTHPTRLTALSTGWFIAAVNIEWESNATGMRRASIRLNGTTFIASEMRMAVTSDVTRNNASMPWYFTAGDYIEAVVTQSSGGALNVFASGSYSPEFALVAV